ncbi:Uncharacterised protein [Klebsiella pneumoniae]|nr:Uncharacterised protein [Klebsiella pneumoniae]
MHAIGQETDGRQRRHGQHQGDEQEVQFTGAPVAAQHAQGLGPDGET